MSSTHTVVGAVVGMTMVAAGPDAVNWSERTDSFPFIGVRCRAFQMMLCVAAASWPSGALRSSAAAGGVAVRRHPLHQVSQAATRAAANPPRRPATLFVAGGDVHPVELGLLPPPHRRPVAGVVCGAALRGAAFATRLPPRLLRAAAVCVCHHVCHQVWRQQVAGGLAGGHSAALQLWGSLAPHRCCKLL